MKRRKESAVATVDKKAGCVRLHYKFDDGSKSDPTRLRTIKATAPTRRIVEAVREHRTFPRYLDRVEVHEYKEPKFPRKGSRERLALDMLIDVVNCKGLDAAMLDVKKPPGHPESVFTTRSRLRRLLREHYGIEGRP